MPVVKGNEKKFELSAKSVVPTVEDLTGAKKQLLTLQTECREFVQFVEDLPQQLAKSRGQMHEIIHNVKTRAEKFSKVIG